MKLKVEEYLRADGSNPYKTWFDSLDAQAAAKVVTAKLRMELGNTSSVKWYAGIGEYVIDWVPHLSGAGRRCAHHPVWRRNEAQTAERHRSGQGIARGIQGQEESVGHSKERNTVITWH
jgi:hypothetical protein